MRLLSSLAPSDRWFRLLVVPALVFIACCIDRNYQTDLWHHLARGREIVRDGRLLNEDRFTYTVPGQPLVDPNWAWQVAFYRLFELGGLPLVQLVNALIVAAAFGVIVAHALRRGRHALGAALVALVAFVGMWQLLLIRPQSLSFLLFALLHAALDAAWQRPRWLLAAPPILAVWTNVHGGFPIGLVLVGAFLLARVLTIAFEERKGPLIRSVFLDAWPLALCLAGCVLATLANPYGWRLYEYVLRTSSRAVGRRIDEWLPPGTATLVGKVWVASMIGVLVLWSRGPRRPAVGDLCVLACFLPFACGAVRMVAWWLLLLPPVLAPALAAVLPASDDEAECRPTASAALACGLLQLAAVLALPWLERVNPFFKLPGRSHRVEHDLQALADDLAQRSPFAVSQTEGGRIYTQFAWGEYLEWALGPRFTVFLDGRIEIYPDEVWDEYAAVTRGRQDWQAILQRYGVDFLILDRAGHHHDLLPFVGPAGGWREVATAGAAVLYERVDRP
jgi:hypothetical protein